METFSTTQKLAAEALGTAFLLAIVVGSGVMGDTLAGGNVALALLANAVATGAGLYVLITIFLPISGAHFNPAVTLAMAARKKIAPGMAIAFVGAQLVGAIAGVWAAHAMFDLEILQVSVKARSGMGQIFGECIATFGLVLTIFGCVRFRPDSIAAGVGFYITAGYWFTSSTSFANPAVTIARAFTDTFAGVRSEDAALFILAQGLAALLAAAIAAWLFEPRDARAKAGYSPADEEGTGAAL
ncbi:MAG: MIP/aquaporin family protein [Pseudomonadota bacterium]